MVKEKKRIQLTAAALRHMTNKQFFKVYDNINTRFEEQDFEDTHILFLHNNVKRHGKSIDLLRNWTSAHDATEIAQGLMSDSREILRGIRDGVYSFERLANASKRATVQLLKGWLKEVEREMVSRTKRDFFYAVSVLKSRLDEDPDLVEALEEINLMEPFITVTTNLNAIEALDMIREEDRSKGKETRRDFRKLVVNDIQMLFNGVSTFANIIWEDRDMYYDFCLSLEAYLVVEWALHKADATRRENEKEKDGDIESDEGDTSTTESDDQSDDSEFDSDEPINN